MRVSTALFVACAVAVSSAPALAKDKMKDSSMMMMKHGEVLAVMPDGHMGTMKMSDDAMMGKMKKSAQAMSGCMMFMTGKDGKTMMVDASSAKMKKECEKIAK